MLSACFSSSTSCLSRTTMNVPCKARFFSSGPQLRAQRRCSTSTISIITFFRKEWLNATGNMSTGSVPCTHANMDVLCFSTSFLKQFPSPCTELDVFSKMRTYSTNLRERVVAVCGEPVVRIYQMAVRFCAFVFVDEMRLKYLDPALT